MKTDKLVIAKQLRDIGDWLAFFGDRSYRRRAYERAAIAVEAVADLDRLIDAGRLTEVPGIGPAIARVIVELSATGTSPRLERASGGLPSGLLELARIPHLSPKRVLELHRALGVSSYDELVEALAGERINEVKGFGEKTVAAIRQGVESYRRSDPSVLHSQAAALAEALRAHLAAHAATVEVAIVGALRRKTETVEAVELVAASHDAGATLDELSRHPKIASIIERADDRVEARLADAVPARLWVVDAPRFAATVFRRTGATAHVDKVERIGIELDGAGDEEEIYRRAALPFIPPELREDAGEVEAARAGERFDDLLAEDDVRGMVHCHTHWSDGRDTIETMARAAEALGFSYLTITDHSKTAHYAGGLDRDRLKAQWDEIARVQERVQIRLLRGTESDILADGALDFDDDVLSELDVVIASVHARFRLDAEQMTARLVNMMRLPVFKIWGHPLGRLLLRRDPIACDVERVLDAAAESRAAIELNGDPHRIDLPPRWIPAARRRGLRFVVSTDAHSARELGNLRSGVMAARRGGLRRGEVLNTLPVEEFMRAVRPA
jgi:DNA polymerase (family 10)